MTAHGLLHEDDDVVAVDKPSGEPVIAGARRAARGVPAEAARAAARRAGCGSCTASTATPPASCSSRATRRPTARSAWPSSTARCRRRYWAFVAGRARCRCAGGSTCRCTRRARARRGPRDPASAGSSRPRPTTRRERVWRLGGETASLVEAHPVTGRHHQIRVHLRSAGAPILFDPLYGRGRRPRRSRRRACARLALHARRIEIPAPRRRGAARGRGPAARRPRGAAPSGSTRNGDGEDVPR